MGIIFLLIQYSKRRELEDMVSESEDDSEISKITSQLVTNFIDVHEEQQQNQIEKDNDEEATSVEQKDEEDSIQQQIPLPEDNESTNQENEIKKIDNIEETQKNLEINENEQKKDENEIKIDENLDNNVDNGDIKEEIINKEENQSNLNEIQENVDKNQEENDKKGEEEENKIKNEDEINEEKQKTSKRKKEKGSRRERKAKSGRSRRGQRSSVLNPNTKKLEKMNTEQEEILKKKLEQEKKERRVTIAQEILQTERSYVSGLTILINSYLRPLREKNIISIQSIRRIFSDIEVLYGFNLQFLTNVENRMKNWNENEQKLGDIFLREVDYLKMYTNYVRNYNESVKEVSICKKKSPKFSEFLDQLRYSEECNGLDLTSYLIMPVQRIPRYVMLLADLLKNTPDSHVDYNDLKAAHEKTKEVADYVNEKKREAENINQVVEIQEKLSGKIDLLEDASRRFVREGPLIDMSGYEKKNRYFYLFNDIMVSSSPGNKEFRELWKKYENSSPNLSLTSTNSSSNTLDLNNSSSSSSSYVKYKETIPLHGSQLKETSPETQELDPKFKNMFQLILNSTLSEKDKRIFSFVAPSYEIKLSWMGDIDECIMQNLDNRKMRCGAFTNYDASKITIPYLSDTLLIQNSETGVWKERFIVLKYGILYFYKSEDIYKNESSCSTNQISSDSPRSATLSPSDSAVQLQNYKFSIEIYSCSVRLLRPSEKEFAFQIFASQEIYYFATNSGEKLFDWINAIRFSIEKIMEFKQTNQSLTKKNQDKFSHLPPSLIQLLTDDENQCCADCNNQAIFWANLTFGVFLCNECYNLHKILSSSNLKSLVRSKWTDKQAFELLSKGNKIVNDQLESEKLKAEKINSTSTYEHKVDFIRRKYKYDSYESPPTTPEQEPKRASTQLSGTGSSPSKKLGRKAGWLVQLDGTENKKYFFILKKSNIYYYKNEVCFFFFS